MWINVNVLAIIWFKNGNFSSCFKPAENAFNSYSRIGENWIHLTLLIEINKGWHHDAVEFADGLLTTSKLRVRSRHKSKCRATCLSVVCWSSSARASWQSVDSHLFPHWPEGGSRRQTSKQASGDSNKGKVVLFLCWSVFTCQKLLELRHRSVNDESITCVCAVPVCANDHVGHGLGWSAVTNKAHWEHTDENENKSFFTLHKTCHVRLEAKYKKKK